MSYCRQSGLRQQGGIPKKLKNLGSVGDNTMLRNIQKTSITDTLLDFIRVQVTAEQVRRQVGFQGAFAGPIGPRKHAQSWSSRAHRRVKTLPETK